LGLTCFIRPAASLRTVILPLLIRAVLTPVLPFSSLAHALSLSRTPVTLTPTPSAARILERCDALARCSEQVDGLTRVYLSPEQRAASALVLQWMRDAGMSARLDAAGNVVGRYEGERPGLPCLMLGSHLDT